MAKVTNKTVMLLTITTILLFSTVQANTDIETCQQKLGEYARGLCPLGCQDGFEDYINTACTTEQTAEDVETACCPFEEQIRV